MHSLLYIWASIRECASVREFGKQLWLRRVWLVRAFAAHINDFMAIILDKDTDRTLDL